jgi:hypothetical protein
MLDKLGHRPHRAGALIALRDVFLDHREREMAADRRDVRGLDAGIREPATERFPESPSGDFIKDCIAFAT